MNNYNPNIHHRRSIRLKGYDYSREGLYYITICVHDRKCLFGEIVGVDDAGVQNFEPLQSPNESVSSVGVENFQPLQKSRYQPLQKSRYQPLQKSRYQSRYQMILNNAGKIADECWLEIPKHFPESVLHEHIVMPNHVHGIVELIQTGSQNESQRNEFQKMIPHSIGSIVKGFKIGVTKWFRNNIVGVVGAENFQPLQPQQIWQRNYYEHIIRNEISYHNISEYIINNPNNWKEDNFFNA